MKLLLDENLSPHLVESLSDLFPGSTHVHSCRLGSAKDAEIWEYTKANGFTVVSKDSGFEERSILLGSPPKIILMRTSNCTRNEVERILRAAFPIISRFILEDEEPCLILGNQQKTS